MSAIGSYVFRLMEENGFIDEFNDNEESVTNQIEIDEANLKEDDHE